MTPELRLQNGAAGIPQDDIQRIEQLIRFYQQRGDNAEHGGFIKDASDFLANAQAMQRLLLVSRQRQQAIASRDQVIVELKVQLKDTQDALHLAESIIETDHPLGPDYRPSMPWTSQVRH